MSQNRFFFYEWSETVQYTCMGGMRCVKRNSGFLVRSHQGILCTTYVCLHIVLPFSERLHLYTRCTHHSVLTIAVGSRSCLARGIIADSTRCPGDEGLTTTTVATASTPHTVTGGYAHPGRVGEDGGEGWTGGRGGSGVRTTLGLWQAEENELHHG